MTMKEMTFNEWMNEVDVELEKMCGMSHLDLEDVCYYDMYEDGYTPKLAAKEAFSNSFY